MKEFPLPSGAILKVGLAPFADAKALFQVAMNEMRGIQISSKGEVANLIKDLVLAGFSSPYVDAALTKCMEKCLYNDARITKDTFEAVEARGDYLAVIEAVATENLAPFLKPLFARFKELTQTIESIQL